MDGFERKYVIAQVSGGERLVYWTGKEYWAGGMLMGDILEAKKFDSMDAVFDEIKAGGSHFMSGFSVIDVCQNTIDAIARSKDAGTDLYRKWNDPRYALN